MFKLNPQSNIQVALKKLENIVKNPENQFRTAGREAIEKLLSEDNDIKYIIENYESVKEQFCNAVNALEASQEYAGQEYKWGFIALIIEKLIQQKAKADAETKESDDDQEEEEEDETKKSEGKQEKDEEHDDAENDEDEDDEFSSLGGKKNQEAINEIKENFTYIPDLIKIPFVSSFIQKKESFVKFVKSYAYKLRALIKKIKAVDFLKDLLLALLKLIMKVTILKVLVKTINTLIILAWILVFGIGYRVYQIVVKPEVTVKRATIWLLDEKKEADNSESDESSVPESVDDGTVPPPK